MILYLICFSLVGGFAFVAVALPRMRMERHAKLLLAAMPERDTKAVYLSFPSPWPWRKRALFDSKKEEVESSGWTFLKASKVTFMKSIASVGGGVTLHFIRKKEANQAL